MDIRPKRRKFKDNPYELLSDSNNNLYYIKFKDINGIHEINVNKEIFDLFDEAEKYENARYKEYFDHIEHSEQTEANLSIKNVIQKTSIENEVINKIIREEISDALNLLPEIQRRRIIKYFFEEKTYNQIAQEEKCSIVSIKYSVDYGIKNLSKNIKDS